MGDCQNYGPFLGPYYNTGPNTGPNLGDPKRDHNFDNPPCPQLVIYNLGMDNMIRPGFWGNRKGIAASSLLILYWKPLKL